MTFSFLIFLVYSGPFDIAFVGVTAEGTVEEPKGLSSTLGGEGRQGDEGSFVIWAGAQRPCPGQTPRGGWDLKASLSLLHPSVLGATRHSVFDIEYL